MKLIFLRGTCDNARVCPNVNATDVGTLVIQGYEAADRSAVRVPVSLVPELDVDGASRVGVAVRVGEDVVIRGRVVTDREALAELALPAGERAVEVPASLLPGLRGFADAQ